MLLVDTNSVENWDWDEQYDKVNGDPLDTMFDQDNADKLRKEREAKVEKQEEAVEVKKVDMSLFFKRKPKEEIKEEVKVAEVISEDIQAVVDSLKETEVPVEASVQDFIKKRGRKPKALTDVEAREITENLLINLEEAKKNVENGNMLKEQKIIVDKLCEDIPDDVCLTPFDDDSLAQQISAASEELVVIEEVEQINPIQRKIELDSYSKTKMSDEQKKELAEIKANEVIHNLDSIKEAMIEFNNVITRGPNINVVDYEKKLNDGRNIRPVPGKDPGPSEIMELLETTSRCIEYFSTPLGDLSRATELLDGAIKNTKDMWTVVSTQGSEAQRKGEAIIQLKEMIARYNELNGLHMAFENEMITLKQQVFIYIEQVKVLQMLSGLNADISNKKSGYEF